MHLTSSDFIYVNGAAAEIAYPCPRVRVKIEIDTHPSDPFEENDGHWPMLVYDCSMRSVQIETKVEIGDELRLAASTASQNWFTVDGLVHNQREIYKILGVTDNYLLAEHGKRWLTDPDHVLLAMEEHEMDDLEKRAELLTLAGVSHLVKDVHGFSQGDWAKLLIIAPRETIIKLRGADADEAAIQSDMAAQAQLYEDWAYGSVYGYTIQVLPEELSDPDDTIDEDWEDAEDGSCWGYYGRHETSGILDQINEVLSYEPAASMIKAHLSDNLTELAA